MLSQNNFIQSDSALNVADKEIVKEQWLSDASLQACDSDWNIMCFLSNQIKAVS